MEDFLYILISNKICQQIVGNGIILMKYIIDGKLSKSNLKGWKGGVKGIIIRVKRGCKKASLLARVKDKVSKDLTFFCGKWEVTQCVNMKG